MRGVPGASELFFSIWKKRKLVSVTEIYRPSNAGNEQEMSEAHSSVARLATKLVLTEIHVMLQLC